MRLLVLCILVVCLLPDRFCTHLYDDCLLSDDLHTYGVFWVVVVVQCWHWWPVCHRSNCIHQMI